jgi:uncharacterized membrane protein HdeD (DUF308 family)
MKLRYFDSDTVSQKWFIFLLRGLLTICFAVILLIHPKLEIEILVFLFGVYILTDAVVTICAGVMSQKEDFTLFGLITIIIGIYSLFPHKESAFFFLSLVAAWSLLRGIFEISAALKSHKKITNNWELILSSGLTSLFFILSILLHPSQVLNIIWILIIYFFSIGVIWIFYAFEIRAIDQIFYNNAHSQIAK